MTRQMPVLVLRLFAVVRQWSAAISRGAAGRPPSRRKACAPWGRGRNARTLGRDGYMSPAYLPQKLDQPLPTKDGGTLRTIREAVDYMKPASPRSESCAASGKRVANLILAKEDVMTVSRALELALFKDAKLDA